MTDSNRGSFGSKIGLILATAGGAVGLGNVWRFPYMAGQEGGAAFILVYIGSVLLLGIPCMISEFIIGRHGASNTARAYTKLSNGTAWKWVGYLEVLTGFLITGYYAVVSGWCLQYVYASIMGELHGDPTFVANYFKEFSSDKVMLPLLFILLLIIVVAACLLPDAGKGVEFLLKPDFGKVDRNVFLNALGQSFYSMSIGMGCICTYASYFSRQTNLFKSALQISIIDLLVAVLAGLMIFPAAFSVGVSPDSGPSLIFITLPNVFNQAFASLPVLGWIISLLFYVLLSVAALTSLMSLHEVNTSFFYEELKIDRKKGATIVTVSCAIIGAFCSLSLGATDKLSFFGKALFDWFDFVTGQIFLPLAGFLTCLFLGWYVPKQIVQDEFTNWGTLKGRLFGIYLFLIKFVCPVLIFLVFLNQFGVFG